MRSQPVRAGSAPSPALAFFAARQAPEPEDSVAARWLDIARKQRRSLGFHASIADFAPGDAEAAQSRDDPAEPRSQPLLPRQHAPGGDLRPLASVDRSDRRRLRVQAAVRRGAEAVRASLRRFPAPCRRAACGRSVHHGLYDRTLRIDAAHPCLQPARRRREPLRAGRPRRARPPAARRGAPAGGNASLAGRDGAVPLPHGRQPYAARLCLEDAQRVDAARRPHPGDLSAGEEPLPLPGRR